MKILGILATLSTLSIVSTASISLPSNFQTDFKQTITNDKNKVISYSGTVKFKNETQIIVDGQGQSHDIQSSMFRWDYQSPTKKEVCTDGIQLIVVDHDLEQISRYIIDEGINLEEILNVAVQMSTTDYKANYKDIEYLITLDSQGWLKKIFYVDNLDNRVRIEFENMNYDNNNFPSGSLDCIAPSDYDVIEG